jgi:hypothetical protein
MERDDRPACNRQHRSPQEWMGRVQPTMSFPLKASLDAHSPVRPSTQMSTGSDTRTAYRRFLCRGVAREAPANGRQNRGIADRHDWQGSAQEHLRTAGAGDP